MLGLLGPDYAMKAPPNFLMLRSHEAHPTELADLHGKRLVAAIETGEGIRINEVLAKELTGKDPIRARRMREDFWEFLPTHKPWLATNHRPSPETSVI
jgi:putative DNA primase/helicase